MSSNGDSEGKRSDLFPEKREGRCCSWGRESAPLKSSVVLPLKGNLPTGKEEIKKILVRDMQAMGSPQSSIALGPHTSSYLASLTQRPTDLCNCGHMSTDGVQKSCGFRPAKGHCHGLRAILGC